MHMRMHDRCGFSKVRYRYFGMDGWLMMWALAWAVWNGPKRNRIDGRDVYIYTHIYTLGNVKVPRRFHVILDYYRE